MLRDFNRPLDPALVVDLKTIIGEGHSRQDYYENGKIAAHPGWAGNLDAIALEWT